MKLCKKNALFQSWTLLDCHFGIPLFDVDANTKICDTIVTGGLTNPSNLQKLVESSRTLGTALLEFISQCQVSRISGRKNNLKLVF